MKIEDSQLRPINKEDLKTVLHWRNTKHVRSSMISNRFVALDELTEWYDTLAQKEALCLLFEIGRIPVGLSTFSHINQLHDTALCSFYLGRIDLPDSCSLLQAYLSLNYGFQNLHLRKTSRKLSSSHQKEISFLRKLGFVQEGCLRKHYQRQGQYEDLIILSLFNEQWKQKRSEIRKEIQNDKHSHRIIANLQKGRSNFQINLTENTH
ncbi:MAG: GNAT family protein [Bacillota bacterium]|nr:GNAT family protein [Bacillota bacterium]